MKPFRIVLGAMFLVVGAVVSVRGQLEWWNGVLFFLAGAAFLFSAFKTTAKG